MWMPIFRLHSLTTSKTDVLLKYAKQDNLLTNILDPPWKMPILYFTESPWWIPTQLTTMTYLTQVSSWRYSRLNIFNMRKFYQTIPAPPDPPACLPRGADVHPLHRLRRHCLALAFRPPWVCAWKGIIWFLLTHTIINVFFYVLGGDGYDNLANAYCHVQLSKFKAFISWRIFEAVLIRYQ